MKNVKLSILCSIMCALTACGGSSSNDKPKSSSSSVVSSSSVSSSSIASSDSSASLSSSSTSSASETSSSAVSSNSSASSVESSSSSTSSVPVVAQTGVFIDSAVAGVTYATTPGGLSGVTSPTGQYQFVEGDTVVFSIGAIEFPPVTAKGVVTPVDMVESGNPADPIVVNIAVLLQSLDTDGDPTNGISVPAAAVAAAEQNVDFDQPYASFAAQVLPVIQHTDSSKTVVSEAAASAHLAESLEQVNASSLVGTWYIRGEDFHYALFVLDESRYAAVDYDTSIGNGTALETGNYVWDQSTGIVTLTSVERTDSELDAEPPMANGNTLTLNGNELTLTDEDESFVLHRLTATEESPLKGGWSFLEEDTLVVFAFTGTHYLMGQHSEVDEVGEPGAEIGTYTYSTETGEFTVATLADTNGQWGLSHPCAVLDLQDTNDLSCGPDGRDIVQTFQITGDTLTFISEADTIANGGEEEEYFFERINGIPDGDIHLKLQVTLTLEEYSQGQKFVRDDGTMQCDLDETRTIGETEVMNESWVLGGNTDRATWLSVMSANFNPETKEITFDVHEPVAPIPGHPGFSQEFWEAFEGTYNAGEANVITGTYTEKYNLTWNKDASVSTCEATYSVVGVLR